MGAVHVGYDTLRLAYAAEQGRVRPRLYQGYLRPRRSPFHGVFEPLIDQGLIDAISVPDGAAILIPPQLYQEVVLPAEKKLFEQVKSRGIGCFLTSAEISPPRYLYPETGADCVSVDVGVTVGEVYDLFAGRLAVAGNVDVVNTIFGGDPASICTAVRNAYSGYQTHSATISSCPPATCRPIPRLRTFRTFSPAQTALRRLCSCPYSPSPAFSLFTFLFFLLITVSV